MSVLVDRVPVFAGCSTGQSQRRLELSSCVLVHPRFLMHPRASSCCMYSSPGGMTFHRTVHAPYHGTATVLSCGSIGGLVCPSSLQVSVIGGHHVVHPFCAETRGEVR